MKAKITRPDGTTIELEGTSAEVQTVVTWLSPAPAPNIMGSVMHSILQPDPLKVPAPFFPPSGPGVP